MPYISLGHIWNSKMLLTPVLIAFSKDISGCQWFTNNYMLHHDQEPVQYGKKC
jgi:hypothetical protein